MKRDMSLVRQILLVLEKDGDPYAPDDLVIDGADSTVVSYHVMLMHQAGLLEANNMTSSSGFEWQPIILTWAGHEFLDAVRDQGVWTKTTAAVARVAGTASFEVLKQVASHMALQAMGMK